MTSSDVDVVLSIVLAQDFAKHATPSARDRFEVRTMRTGALEAAFASFNDATRYADELRAEFGDRCAVVDTFLPIDGKDDRIVWRQD